MRLAASMPPMLPNSASLAPIPMKNREVCGAKRALPEETSLAKSATWLSKPVFPSIGASLFFRLVQAPLTAKLMLDSSGNPASLALRNGVPKVCARYSTEVGPFEYRAWYGGPDGCRIKEYPLPPSE